jgi:PAS domain S-box-containing protein
LWSGLGSSAATRLLADAFERAPIGMALIDGTGTHIAVNPALADLLGCPSTELVGRSCWDAVHPDDLALDQARLDAVLRGELPGYSLDERYVDTHGTSVWVEVTVGGVPEPPSERGPARLLRQIRSIEDRLQAAQRQSEVERLNVRLSEQTEVLAEANVRLAGFASALSHDLHQPLAALGAYLDLLVEQRTADLDADAANWLAGAHHSAGILRDAVSALRDTAQGFPVALGPVDLAATFDEALAELASELDEAGAEVDITSLPVVLGDRAMLGRVVANVLGNACRYRDATRPLRISIEARGPAADRVVVVIADNGRGFAPHELDSVFTPGRRGSAAFDRAGTGFGLFIVRSVINNLGGEVWAETADTGARVCIALRRGDAEDIAADVRLRATVAEQPS